MQYLFLTNNFATVHSNSSISETVRNGTHVHINSFFRMTDTIISQNIDPSSWDTCIHMLCVWNISGRASLLESYTFIRFCFNIPWEPELPHRRSCWTHATFFRKVAYSRYGIISEMFLDKDCAHSHASCVICHRRSIWSDRSGLRPWETDVIDTK
jgi:hypothetical protein